MTKKVVIIDYGLGNILSVQQSFLKVASENNLEAKVIITKDPKEVANSTHIILPGQGAFKTCMDGLLGIEDMVRQLTESVIKNKTPFLGICVGMQLLANTSYENGKHEGLGWVEGEIKKLPDKNIKLPHMGWNEVIESQNNNYLLKNGKNKDYYFVHSYYFDCNNSKNIAGTTNYGKIFTSFVAKENIYGVQFHPEKSSDQGLILINNFLKL